MTRIQSGAQRGPGGETNLEVDPLMVGPSNVATHVPLGLRVSTLELMNCFRA